MAKIVFTEPAEYDLLEIEYYIFTELCNPEAAKKVTTGILKVVQNLGEYPICCSVVEDEVLGGVGLRRTYFDNYNIFYFYNYLNDVVYIIRILYNKSDWQSILKK